MQAGGNVYAASNFAKVEPTAFAVAELLGCCLQPMKLVCWMLLSYPLFASLPSLNGHDNDKFCIQASLPAAMPAWLLMRQEHF